MTENRWPVSDREVKPRWFHALNWTCAALLLLAAAIALIAAGTWIGHALELT